MNINWNDAEMLQTPKWRWDSPREEPNEDEEVDMEPYEKGELTLAEILRNDENSKMTKMWDEKDENLVNELLDASDSEKEVPKTASAKYQEDEDLVNELLDASDSEEEDPKTKHNKDFNTISIKSNVHKSWKHIFDHLTTYTDDYEVKEALRKWARRTKENQKKTNRMGEAIILAASKYSGMPIQRDSVSIDNMILRFLKAVGGNSLTTKILETHIHMTYHLIKRGKLGRKLAKMGFRALEKCSTKTKSELRDLKMSRLRMIKKKPT